MACSIVPRRPGGSRIAPPDERVAAIVALRRLRMTAAEIAELLGMALSTVSGILKRIGMGRLGRLGLERPVRYEYSRPGELVHIDVKKLGRIVGGAGQRYAAPGTADDAQRRAPSWHRRLGVRPRRRRRLQPPRLRRGAPGRKSLTAIGFLRRAVAYYRATASASSASSPTTAPVTAPRSTRSPASTRHPPQPHPPLPAPDQRQSRTLHPHPARRLGLRRHLPLKPRTHHSP